MALADAGTASLATFAAGLIALRSLDDGELALYALILSAATALMILPQYMSYLPQRMHANRARDPHRTDYAADLRSAAPYAALTAVGVIAAGLPLRGQVDGAGQYAILVGTAALFVAVSPFQDNQRASLHMVGRHGRAAATSAVNLATVIAVFAAAEIDGGEHAWLSLAAPFGSLVAGNALSAVAGYMLHRDVAILRDRDPISLASAALVSSHALVRQGSAYAGNLAVAAILSPVALATLETARVAAQPVFILGTGVASFFMPQAVRAIGAGDHARAGRVMRRLMGTVAVGGGLYALLVVPLAPLLTWLVGRPLDVPLTSARAASFALSAASNPFNSFNIAERRYGLALALTVASEAPAFVLLVLTLAPLGMYAVPLAAAAAAVLRIVLNVIERRRRPAPAPTAGDDAREAAAVTSGKERG